MPRTRWTTPEHRPDNRQREDVRAVLHQLVDQCIDAWPEILRQAREMGRGFPSGGSSGGHSGGTSPVEAQVANPRADPALWANEWLAEWAEAMAHLRNAGGHLHRVLPIDPELVERGRVNTVEVCGECGRPVVTGKRLDGHLLHIESPGTNDHGEPIPVCWWARYNRTRGRREA